MHPNLHAQNCECDECRKYVVDIFKAFDIEPLSKNLELDQVERSCPICGLRKRPKKKGYWYIWSCWLHNYIEAIVFSFKTGDFGFADAIGDDHRIYFHMSHQKRIECNGSDFPNMRNINIDEEGISKPEEGDTLIIHEMYGNKGAKAYWWAFKAELIQALEEIEYRPTYRLVKREKTNVLWQGKNLADLRSLFRTNKFMLRGNLYFQRYDRINGTNMTDWVLCDDPR